MKKDNLIKILFITTFFVILLIFMIPTLLNNEKISNLERRTLTTFPKFSINKIFKKSYYDDLTKAFQDQLEFRNYLVKGYFLFQFQRYYGDAVIGKNSQLYSPSQIQPNKNYYTNLKSAGNLVNKVSSKTNAKFIFLSIPRKDAYMKNELPKTYNSSFDIYQKQVSTIKETLNKDIIFIDALEVFQKSKIYNCYYSNDHHITPKCSYELYKEINKYTGVKSYDLNKEFKIHKTIVNGGYNRQLGQTVKSKEEDLYLTPKKGINYIRYENGKKSSEKVYGKGNTYEEAYMNGDKAYTVLENNIAKGKNIMFVGSSYTNILEAMSLPSYKNVVSIDYRHNKKNKEINYYVKKHNIDYVVFVPAQSNNSFSLPNIKMHLGLK